MDAWGSFALGVCGGGGSDTLAAIVVVVIAALYGWAVLAVLAKAEDGTEQAMLIILLTVSIAIGGFLFLYPGGIEGDGDFLTRFIISLIVVSMIAVAASAIWREASVGRAVFVAVAGDVLIPGGLLLLFLSSMLIGTGCLS